MHHRRIVPERRLGRMAKTPSIIELSEFVNMLVLAKHRAGQLGLFRTMHALDSVTQEVGWEVAEKSTGKSTVAERDRYVRARNRPR